MSSRAFNILFVCKRSIDESLPPIHPINTRSDRQIAPPSWWALTGGQRYLEPLTCAAIPGAIVAREEDVLGEIK